MSTLGEAHLQDTQRQLPHCNLRLPFHCNYPKFDHFPYEALKGGDCVAEKESVIGIPKSTEDIGTLFVVFSKLFAFRINYFLSSEKTVAYLPRSTPRAIQSVRVGQEITRWKNLTPRSRLLSILFPIPPNPGQTRSKSLSSGTRDGCLPSSGLPGPRPSL